MLEIFLFYWFIGETLEVRERSARPLDAVGSLVVGFQVEVAEEARFADAAAHQTGDGVALAGFVVQVAVAFLSDELLLADEGFGVQFASTNMCAGSTDASVLKAATVRTEVGVTNGDWHTKDAAVRVDTFDVIGVIAADSVRRQHEVVLSGVESKDGAQFLGSFARCSSKNMGTDTMTNTTEFLNIQSFHDQPVDQFRDMTANHWHTLAHPSVRSLRNRAPVNHDNVAIIVFEEGVLD